MTSNKIKAIVCAALLLTPALKASAQFELDTIITVENDFRPTVKDADKINALPEVEQVTVNHYNVRYTTKAFPTLNYTFQPVWAAHNQALLKPDKTGFAALGYGMNNNVLGHAAYQGRFDENNLFSAELSIRGYNGDIAKSYEKSDWKSRMFQNRAKVGYEHRIGASALTVDFAYGTDIFNYQPMPASPLPKPASDRQHNNRLALSARLTPLHLGSFFISADAAYRSFNQQYVTSMPGKMGESIIAAHIAPGFRLSDDMAIDVELGMEKADYSGNDIESLTSLSARPHISWHGDNVDLRAGAYVNDNSDIAPDVDVIIHTAPTTDIYVKATGGSTLNSFSRLADISPYWALYGQPVKIDMQFDQLKARGGVRLMPFDGLHIDLNGGYEITKNRAEILEYKHFMSNYQTFAPIIFADGKRIFGNVNMRYTYRDIFEASINATYNDWKSDYKETGSDKKTVMIWRPQMEGTAAISLQPVHGLKFGADLQLATFKRDGTRYRQPKIMNLGASISYTFSDFTVFVKGDNLLNQDFDRYIMYRAQGLNCLGGVTLKF